MSDGPRRCAYQNTRVHKKNIWACDFETTSRANLERDGYVRVWLWGAVNVGTGEVKSGNDISTFMELVSKSKMMFFHNLKFDGGFIASWCLSHNVEMDPLIDGMNNVWYTLKVKIGKNVCEIRDSMKKFPMSLQALAKGLGIPGKDTKPDFYGYRPEGYIPTSEETAYCIQDCRIVAVAIGKEWDAGRVRLTASGEAYGRLKKGIKNFSKMFPELTADADAFVRKTYAGGISWLKPEHAGKDLEDIWVADINSSFPARMCFSLLPYGMPIMNRVPEEGELYCVRFKTSFKVKKDHMPFLQKNRSLRFGQNMKSDNFITDSEGEMELYLTSVDHRMFREQYDIEYEKDHEYICFKGKVGICAPVILDNNARKEKATTEGNKFERQTAKLDSNMSYGSFGINPLSYNGTPIMDDNGIVRLDCAESDRKGRYVPYAAFVTAYAREALVHAIQANWESFVYCDTDSIHCLEKPVGIEYDKKALGKWDLEGHFAYGRYLRPKCYMHVDEEKNTIWERDEYGILDIETKAAGIPDEAKLELNWDNFRLGYEVKGKLQHCAVPGGVCLMEVKYTV